VEGGGLGLVIQGKALCSEYGGNKGDFPAVVPLGHHPEVIACGLVDYVVRPLAFGLGDLFAEGSTGRLMVLIIVCFLELGSQDAAFFVPPGGGPWGEGFLVFKGGC
jgi:hypothetical protein